MAKMYFGNQEIGAEQFIDSEHLNNGAVTTSKIADGAVTDTKLDPSIMSEISEISGKQDELVSGENIKTINGESVLGSGDLVVTTYQTFNPNWKTNGTTKQFCDDVNTDESAVVGMAYLGGVTFTDFPASGIANADIVVEIIAITAGKKVIKLTMTSGSVVPYHWEYTYWNNGNNVSGWKSWQTPLTAGDNITISNNGRISATDTTYTAGTNVEINGTVISATDTTYSAGTGLSLDGTEFSVDTTVVATQQELSGKQDILTAGSNITINNNEISATDTTYTAGNGIDIENDEISVDTDVIATKEDLTGKQDVLESGENIKTVNNESILGSGDIQIETITDYDELSNIPIINQVTGTGFGAYSIGDVLQYGSKIHFDTSLDWDTIIQNILTEQSAPDYEYFTIFDTTSSSYGYTLKLEIYREQVGVDTYVYYLRCNNTRLYSTNGGFNNLNTDDDYVVNSSGSVTFTINSLLSSNLWNGTAISKYITIYTPAGENGKFYKHDNEIYKYENDGYHLVVLNRGHNFGKDSVAILNSSVALGDRAVVVGTNLRPRSDEHGIGWTLSGSGTTYVAEDQNGNPLYNAVVGDYFYYNGVSAKILSMTSGTSSYFYTHTYTVDKPLVDSYSDYIEAQYYKSTEGQNSFSEGYMNATIGFTSHAEGSSNTASGDCSHAEGGSTISSGNYSHAEGSSTTASGSSSHAEGGSTLAIGGSSHAEGSTTMATGNYSHAEGVFGVASGSKSHIEGAAVDSFQMKNVQLGYNQFYVEDSKQFKTGTKFRIPNYKDEEFNVYPVFEISQIIDANTLYITSSLSNYVWNLQYNSKYKQNYWITCYLLHEVSGEGSHVEGQNNIVSGNFSHVEGKYNNVTKGSQHVFGEYADANTAAPVSQLKLDISFYETPTGYNNTIRVFSNNNVEKYSLPIVSNTTRTQTFYTYKFPENLIVESTDILKFGGGYTGSVSLQDLITATEGGQSYSPYYKIQMKNVVYAAPENHGKYVEVVGNGTPNAAHNARTLDWQGNEELAGGLTAASVTAGTIAKSGGTSSQFLKADGSVDSTAYLPGTNFYGYSANYSALAQKDAQGNTSACGMVYHNFQHVGKMIKYNGYIQIADHALDSNFNYCYLPSGIYKAPESSNVHGITFGSLDPTGTDEYFIVGTWFSFSSLQTRGVVGISASGDMRLFCDGGFGSVAIGDQIFIEGTWVADSI